MRLSALLFSIVMVMTTAPETKAHEFWIAPQSYQIPAGEVITADFVNGQEFQGATLAWFDNRVSRAEAVINGEVSIVTGRLGDMPAINHRPAGTGLLTLLVETTPATVNYREAEKFANFVTHKNLDVDAAAQDYPFKEVYTRHVKTLIQVGDGQGADRAMGLATEFVALENPYTDDMRDGIDLLILYQGTPKGLAQVEVFQMDPEGAVTIAILNADAEGRVTVPVLPDHHYLVDSVTLRRPAIETLNAVAAPKTVKWETLWAALTFAVPR